jgi:hypothetical protein
MDMAQVVAGIVATLAASGIGLWLAGRYRAGAEARRLTAKRGLGVQLPVRVRGRAPEYPSYWRFGLLSSDDGIYRPKGRWGEELELAGMRVVEEAEGGQHGMNGAHAFLTILECVDSRGRNVLIAAGEGDVELLTETLEKPSRAPEPPRRMRRMRWLRNRLYFGIALMVAIGAITGAPVTIATATSTSVEATITRDPGGDMTCFVEARYEGRLLTGRHSCDGKAPGDRVQMFVLGWPLTGMLEESESIYILAVLTWTPAWLGLMFHVIMRFQRRLPRHRLVIPADTAAPQTSSLRPGDAPGSGSAAPS